jgi:hypothetical protein
VTPSGTRLTRAGLLLIAAAGAWCEAGAETRVGSRLAAQGAGFAGWDLDIDGLHLDGAHAIVRGRRIAAERIDVTASADGIAMHVEGIVVHSTPVADKAAPTEDSVAATTDRFRVANRGIPIAITTSGALEWPLGRDLVARVIDPRIDIDRGGWPTIRAAARLAGALSDEIVVDELVASHDAGRWHVTGELVAPGGAALALDGSSDDTMQTLAIRDDTGASLTLSREPATPTVQIEATDFPLRHAGPLLAAVTKPRGVRLDDATLSGVVEATVGEAMRVHAEGVVARGVVVEDLRLSSRPVGLGEVSVDGDAVLHDGRVELQLVVGRGEARIAIGGHADRARAELDLDLAEMPCDALLGAMPDGTADALVGMRLGGTIAASAHLALSFTALDRVRRREAPPPEVTLARTHAQLDPETPIDEAPTPGELELDFPFLERCRTIADPANVDLAALRGPYRHRFVDDTGKLRDRVLAPGSPDFAPLGRVPKLATAFIGLEDMRYWYHDGFDREQIERAFWHNVVSGKVRRGASTISQQTARNLWLGVDRSIARKLQEAYLTTRLETAVSKTRILELYVNLVELGPDIYGVDAAARFYFGVPATELDVLQAIHIAMLAPAPRTYAQKWKSGEVDAAWMAELRGHVKRLHRNRMIKPADYRAALKADLRLLDRRG